MIRRILSLIRERRARKRLAEIVRDTRNSYECRRYRERRAAALKGLKKPSGGVRRTDEGTTPYAQA